MKKLKLKLKLKQIYYLRSFKNYLEQEVAALTARHGQQKNNIQQNGNIQQGSSEIKILREGKIRQETTDAKIELDSKIQKIQRIIKLIDPLLRPFHPEDMEKLSAELIKLDELRNTPHLMNIYETLLLGICYVAGIIMKNNLSEIIKIAKEIFESLEDLQNPCRQFFLALTYYYLKINYDRSLELFKKASERNYKEAFAMLGLYYEYGYGSSLAIGNFKEAIRTYKSGINQHCPMAQYYLGLMYSTGTYVSQDYKKAFDLIKPTAEFVNSALFDLGAFYEKGFIGRRDLFRAKRYYEAAALEDSIHAHDSLVKIYSITWYPSLYKDKFYQPMRSLLLAFQVKEHYHVTMNLLAEPIDSMMPGFSAPQTTLELQEQLLFVLEKSQKPEYLKDFKLKKSSYYKTLCDLAFYYQWGFNNSQDIDLAIKLYKQGISMVGGYSCQWDLLSCYKMKISDLANPEYSVTVNAMLAWYKSFVKTDAEANFILAEIIENGLFGLPPRLFDAYQYYHQGYLITQQKIESEEKANSEASSSIESMSIQTMQKYYDEYNTDIAQHLSDLKKNSETYLLMFNQKNIILKQDSATKDLIPEMAELIAEYAADLPENTIRLPKDKLIL